MRNANHGALLTWVSDRRTCPDEVRRVPADRLIAYTGEPTDFIAQKDGFLCMTVNDEVLDDPARNRLFWQDNAGFFQVRVIVEGEAGL